VTSVDTHEPQRDAHLRSADFFERTAHVDYLSRALVWRKKGKERLAVTGDLTIRGTTPRFRAATW